MFFDSFTQLAFGFTDIMCWAVLATDLVYNSCLVKFIGFVFGCYQDAAYGVGGSSMDSNSCSSHFPSNCFGQAFDVGK